MPRPIDAGLRGSSLVNRGRNRFRIGRREDEDVAGAPKGQEANGASGFHVQESE